MKETVRAESVECLFCKHLFSEDSAVVVHACSAYPYGIPDAFLKGYVKHHVVTEDQTGEFVFERKEID